jgi:hypothetical protein
VQLLEAAAAFSEEPHPKECLCDHQLQETGAVFFQSVGLIHCAICSGWQLIRKPVK